MQANHIRRHVSLPRTALIAGAMLAATIAAPLSSVAQTTAQPEPVAYAIADLNLRKGPGNTDAIFTVIPAGAAVQRAPGEVRNEYVPVVYDGINGWVLELALAATPEAIPAAGSPGGNESLELYQADTRVTLTPLMLRSGPDIEAEPITGMPEGALITLTREGYENGYVTVDYDGARGWAYADFLATLEEVS